jgi:Mg2+ and Co2+ transporter CorA
MLTTYPAAAREQALHATRKVLWIDLLDPTDEEKASVETPPRDILTPAGW